MESSHLSYNRMSKEFGSESLPFLNGEKDSNSALPSRHHDQSESSKAVFQRLRGVFSSKWFLVHGIFILLYTASFVILIRRELRVWPFQDSRLSLYSPAADAIEYEARPVDGLAEGSVYAGYPRPESEAAWRTLMQGSNVKIYPEEMAKLKETSLEMRDGSGSLAVLGAYHELHCVKRLRKWFYKEYYYPNQTDLEFNERMTHAEHCMEFLRQSAMCHGDITVTSFKWLHDRQGHVIEPTTKEGALHRCVKWDRISAWTQKRRVNLFDPILLVPEGGHAQKHD